MDLSQFNYLPVTDCLPELFKQIAGNNKVVLTAPPGAGKTTIVPLALLQLDLFNQGMIVVLEPRRLAARHAAKRMAAMLGESVGETVGFQVRGERKKTARTRVLMVTEGILTRMLQADPELPGVVAVIFDEFHERSVHADLGLALGLQTQSLLRPDLRIIVMSATLDAAAVSALMDKAPIVESKGTLFYVETHYVATPGVLDRRQTTAKLAEVCLTAVEENRGDILVFLAGAAEIHQLEKRLLEQLSNSTGSVSVLPLYASMSLDAQQRVLAPADKDTATRKIILATNIAQTSLTIEGVRVVVDSGWVRVARFDPGSGMTSMQTIRIAKDAADQRRGRAGRLEDGVCYRLWSFESDQRLAVVTEPEILHSDMSSLCLELAHWGVQDPAELTWMDVPAAGSFASAQDLLRWLGALDQENRITAFGKQLGGIPASPRIARMLAIAQGLDAQVSTEFVSSGLTGSGGRSVGFLDIAGLVAALLIERDNFKHLGTVDLEQRVRLLLELSKNDQRARQLHKTARLLVSACDSSFAQHSHEQSPQTEVNDFVIAGVVARREIADPASLCGLLLALAYPDRLAKNRGSTGRFLMSNGKGAGIDEEDSLSREKWVAIGHLDNQLRNARVFSAASVSEAHIRQFFGHEIKLSEEIFWDAASERVHANELEKLGALELSSSVLTNADKSEIDLVMLSVIRERGLQCLNFSEKTAMLIDRIEFLRWQLRHTDGFEKQFGDATGTASWPDCSQQGLIDGLEEWLLPGLAGHSKLSNLQSLDVFGLLVATMDWSQQKILDDCAPERVDVASGSRIKVDYSNPQSPVLEVRIQEVFGTSKHPCVANGRVPLVLHLLSPARRPVQVTSDLVGFWDNSYPEVRKELRSRYQKHFWPEDPASAAATTRTKKAMDRSSSGQENKGGDAGRSDGKKGRRNK